MATVKEPTMLVDQSLCVGCEACSAVCKQIYELPKGVFRTKIDTVETGSYPQVSINYNKKACMHCEEAACVMACPTGACHKNDLGLTIIDDSLCIECNYCVANCPFEAITFDRGEGRMEKCDLCATRLQEEREPLCADVCTSRIIKFGEREEMLRQALDRVEQLKENGYEEAQVYGINEMGGLRVLTVLSDTPEKYGLPKDPQAPLGLRLWKAIPLTPAVLIAGGLIVGANYLYSRKIQDKLEDAQKSK